MSYFDVFTAVLAVAAGFQVCIARRALREQNEGLGDAPPRFLFANEWAPLRRGVEPDESKFLKHRAGKTYEIASIHYKIGLRAHDHQQLAKAWWHYHQALLDCKDDVFRASVYHQLGVLALDRQDFPQAERLHVQAAEIFIRHNAFKETGHAVHQLGVVAHASGDRLAARRYYERALEIFIECDEEIAAGPTQHQLGVLAEEQGRLESAEHHYLRAVEVSQAVGGLRTRAESFRQLAALMRKQNRLKRAEWYWDRARLLFAELDDDAGQAVCQQHLSLLALEQYESQVAGRPDARGVVGQQSWCSPVLRVRLGRRLFTGWLGLSTPEEPLAAVKNSDGNEVAAK